MLTPSCRPAWLGRPPRMLRPFGDSITLASSRIVASRPPLPAVNVSISLPLIVSVRESPPSFEIAGLCATTSTLAEMPSIGRSIATSVERPTATSTTTLALTNDGSEAVTLYLPGGKPMKLKRPSSPDRICPTCLPALSVTMISEPGRRTVLCVVTSPCSTPVRGGGVDCAPTAAGTMARRMRTSQQRKRIRSLAYAPHMAAAAQTSKPSAAPASTSTV